MNQEQNRRDFLKQGVIAGAEIALCGMCVCGCASSEKCVPGLVDKEVDERGEEVEKMIAFCGLICAEDCPAFKATREDDDEARKEIAERWSSEQYPLKPEDINCDGCLIVGGRLIKFCRDCQVRSCGLDRKVKNCAYCEEYPCDKLDEIHGQAPKARQRLDEIRRSF